MVIKTYSPVFSLITAVCGSKCCVEVFVLFVTIGLIHRPRRSTQTRSGSDRRAATRPDKEQRAIPNFRRSCRLCRPVAPFTLTIVEKTIEGTTPKLPNLFFVCACRPVLSYQLCMFVGLVVDEYSSRARNFGDKARVY